MANDRSDDDRTRGSRLEHDTMGSIAVPANALYGAETARALSWSFSAQPLPTGVVRALGRLKAAAARVHGEAGRLPPQLVAAIERAALEVARGDHDEQFVVGVFQTGSGTSSHMNANEVIAARATALLEPSTGATTAAPVHAHDHVNLGQSSNDVMPSALLLAAIDGCEQRLLPALSRLIDNFDELGDRHWDDVRNGRTHLMAAMPIRFGQQFRGHAQQLAACRTRIVSAVDQCRELPLGGTAVGTGVNCPPGFAAAVCAALGTMFGVSVRETDRHLSAQASLGAVPWLSGDLRNTAASLYKLSNDLRWQASDARRELDLPALQPGSSIMVGKFNPVVCEAVLMACAQVIGNDAVVAFAESQGQFELNTMMPVAAHNLLGAIELLAGACDSLGTHALQGLRVRNDAANEVAANPILATALVAELGHDGAAELARRAAATGKPVLELALQTTSLSPQLARQLLDVGRLCGELGRHRTP